MSRVKSMRRTTAMPAALAALAALTAGTLLAAGAVAESASPAPATHGKKSSNPAPRQQSPRVSPYARAAAEHAHAGQPSTGRGQTTLQAAGRPSKAKPGARPH